LRALLPTGVIFDCDGTLVDSEPLAGRAWKATVAPYGYEVTDADLAACMGRPYAKTHAYLSERVTLPDAAHFWPDLRDELFSLIDTELAPFADAVSAAAELRERGVRLAVASSSPRERLDRTLERAGLEFAVTVAGDEVEHGKPAPDMFLKAAAALDVAPERCVVVEDSAPGVAAGLAARMPTLGVRRVDHADLAGADAVVDVISADAILALLAR
jgi:HAD superfamily hydrolase (TIGR01509 family)